MTQSLDYLITNVNVATMTENGQPYGMLRNQQVGIKDGLIAVIDHANAGSHTANQMLDAEGQWLLPGFIDCHTHLVYGGNRANEFEQRQRGISYTEIAQQGGGIQQTVRATRQASEHALLTSAIKRAERLVEEGVTCVEVKSGYGLDIDTELKMLRVAAELEKHLPVTIVTTYLGAHTVPPEFKENADAYVNFMCEHVIPVVAEKKLATSIDVFCETIGFTPAQCERVFQAAQLHQLRIKAHVEQLSDLKGAVLAAKYHALSVDHIEYLQEDDVVALKQSGTTAVLLPGAFYFLREKQLPPIAALRQHQVPMALATDLNPGSSPVASLLSIINMGCILFGLTTEEALKGVTVNAAKALGLTQKGRIAVGMDADLCLWDIEQPGELAYGLNLCRPQRKWVAGHAIND